MASPLQQRAFAGVWSAGLISDTGDWFLIIALPLFIFGATGSALSTSALFLAELVPALILGSFAGVFADRFDPATTLVRVNLAQALVLLPLLAVGRHRLWIVFVVAGAEALLETLFTPSKQTLLRRLLQPEQLRAGNALIGVNENLARLVGSPLGGLVIAAAGLRVTVAIDAASYLLSAALIMGAGASVPRRGTQTSTTAGYFGEWLTGLVIVRRSRRLRALVMCAVTAQLAQGMFVILFVVFVKRSLAGSDAEVGLIRGLQAVGAVTGGLCVSARARRSSFLSGRLLVGGGLLVFGLLSLATWNGPHLSTTIWLYATMFALLGIPSVAIDAGITTEIQLETPIEALGRVVAVGDALSRAAEALGLLLAGALADHLSLLLDVQGSIYVACGLAGLLLLREAPRKSGPAVSG